MSQDHSRQRDRQDYYGNTALCTIVHRAVKSISVIARRPSSTENRSELILASMTVDMDSL